MRTDSVRRDARSNEPKRSPPDNAGRTRLVELLVVAVIICAIVVTIGLIRAR